MWLRSAFVLAISAAAGCCGLGSVNPQPLFWYSLGSPSASPRPATWRSALRPAALGWRRACLVLWQAEHALADDVALDLAGAARDGVLPRAQDAVVPARAVRDLLARPVHERVGAQQLAPEARDAHPQLRAEQLQGGPLGPPPLAAEPPGQVPPAPVAPAPP